MTAIHSKQEKKQHSSNKKSKSPKPHAFFNFVSTIRKYMENVWISIVNEPLK